MNDHSKPLFDEISIQEPMVTERVRVGSENMKQERTSSVLRGCKNWLSKYSTAMLMAVLLPVVSTHAAGVSVDQSPLIIQKPLPPDIVLMLDDSGSMSWNYMPDSGYLLNPTGTENNGNPSANDYRAYNVNGIYYNPTITYQPAVDATGNAYSQTTFPEGYTDPFNSSNTTNITTYSSTYAYGTQLSSVSPTTSCPSGYTQSGSNCVSSVSAAVSGGAVNASSATCNSNYTYYSSDGLCHRNNNYNTTRNPLTYSCPSNYDQSSNSPPQCTPSCPSGYTFDGSTQSCTATVPLTATCPAGTTPYPSYGTPTSCRIYAFTYNSGSYNYANGTNSYVAHYVAQNCGTQTNCVLDTDTSGTAAPVGVAAGQNVANWFSYYRTRILMAKTGLTLAFSTLDPAYRFGFGSINGNNTGGIPSPRYSFSTSTNGSNRLAEVEPFGDGTSSTQKAQFWNWLIGESANGSTPLRGALQAVGQYYQTTQPWLTGGAGTDANTSYACRPAFTILTTDGFWNGSTPSGIGDVDGNTQSFTQNNVTTTTYTPTAPFKDQNSTPGYSNTLADVAMYYWANDLQPNLDNEVPTTPRDPANWQHMTTFTMGLGFSPTGISPSGTTIPQIFSWADTGTAPTGVTAANFSWPAPASNSIHNIADLAHAAVNGHGDFFSAKNPTDFVNGLQSALASIADRQGAGNAVTQSGATLPTVSSSSDPFFQFRATYTTGKWTGTLTASYYDTTLTTPGYVQDWTTNSWAPSFSTVSGVSLSNRNVWTSTDGTSTGSVAFRKASDLSSAEQSSLAAYSAGTVSAQTMLNYLLGDNTYEAGQPSGTLRARTAVLGDVVSSTPVYVAEPDKTLYENATFTGASTYQTFVSNNASRAPLVYVAANDGMLHVFRVTAGAGYDISGSTVTTDSAQPAGTEVYAYMPEAVLTQSGAGSITNLANPQYGVVNGVDGTQAVPHQYYNDGRITVQNVYFSSDSSWHTVLVGTTGRGPAKAIYALDITNPSVLMNPATAKDALLWERSAGDSGSCSGSVTTNCSNYIGEMTGAPVIAQIKQGGVTSWAVFVGNGYNSPANTAALLQFDLQTGALTVHTTDGTANNGLAEPGLMQGDTNTGLSTYAFGGDLFGNVWKFDLSSATSAGSSIFTAKDASGVTQPITSLISLDYDSSTNSTFALFGTGKYLSSDDINSTQVQTWYGIRVGMGADLAGATNSNTPVVSSSSTRSNLTARYAVDDSSGNRATSLQTSATDMNGMVGWYMDLPVTGERIVNRTQFISGKAVVTTLIPKVSDPCNTVPKGALMIVDPFTGANQASDFGLGTTTITYTNAAGQTVTQTVAINGQVFSSGAAAGVTANYTASGQINISFNTLSGGLQTLGPLTLGGGASGRVSWRELVN